jgi:succinyl-CoA synthetase beta subunit
LATMGNERKKSEERRSLSEYESKRRLARYDIPVVDEELVTSADAALEAAHRIGLPVVLKACGSGLAHKTDLGVVELNLRDDNAVTEAYNRIVERAPKDIDGVLVQEMARGHREFICGLIRDQQFGPCVMLGTGGIYVEAFGDVVFRVAPIELRDAFDMMDELKGRALLAEFRGEKAVDRETLGGVLVGLGRMGIDEPDVHSVDINPLIVRDGVPVAVDALVVTNSSDAD